MRKCSQPQNVLPGIINPVVKSLLRCALVKARNKTAVGHVNNSSSCEFQKENPGGNDVLSARTVHFRQGFLVRFIGESDFSEVS